VAATDGESSRGAARLPEVDEGREARSTVCPPGDGGVAPTPCSSPSATVVRCGFIRSSGPGGTLAQQSACPSCGYTTCGIPGNTLAAATGASTKELMARMGHASPQAALIYQHATADRDRAIADALSDLASGAAGLPMHRGRDRSDAHDRGVAQLGHVQVSAASEHPSDNDPQAFDQPLCSHPQRDSNPCCRLERAVS
jgi:hypothetical protein